MSVLGSQPDAAQAAADVVFATSELRPCLTDVLVRVQAAWKEHDAPWWDPPEVLAAYLDGGKALRPRFCYWGHAIAGEGAGPLLLRAAAALELLHAFALIHDDLVGDSDTCRGRPAVHREVAGQHRRHGWSGNPDGYGRSTAMLIGDLASAVASRLAAALSAPARGVWHGMVEELVMGQFLDLAGAVRQGRSIAVACITTLLKSGRYTVTGPLSLGTALGGLPELPPGLSRCGDLVGETFQLNDDLLGVFRDPQRTGKPVDEGLASGKPTQLLASAADMLPPHEQALLALVGTPALTRADVAELIRCGARDTIERKIRRHVELACSLIEDAALAPRVTAALQSLAMAATGRQR